MTNKENLSMINDETGFDFEAPEFAWPTLVAVIVTHNPGEWLEECLSSLSRQEYPDLTTLVVDVGLEVDVSDRVAKVMPNAFVRQCDPDTNFAEAVNVAVNSIEGATYVLICHDDVVFEQGAVAGLVEEAFRSNASIVGPKVVDATNSEKLLEVGLMVDRFGVPFSGIEHDEVDQGQHDGVRDVFYVSSATMLVRADLFRALEGFDEKCFPGAEDIDLAWRAHLVGARVLVQPDSKIKHYRASDKQRKSRTSATAIVARHRMRAVLKNASPASLAWILPVSFILHSIEGLVWLLRFEPKRAWLLFSGWIWNIKNLKSTRAQRATIQKTREVSDRDIANHQIGGSARARRFLTNFIRNRQIKQITSASKNFAANRYKKRTRETPIYLTAFFIYLLSVRTIVFNGVPKFGEFALWPSFSEQLSSLSRGGLPAASEPMVSSTLGRLISLVLTVMMGFNNGLAQTLFILSLIPLGVFGVRFLLKDRAMGPRSVAVSAVVYGTFAMGIFSFEYGNLGALVLLAGLPYFLKALLNRKSIQAGLVAALVVTFSPSSFLVFGLLSIFYVLVGERLDGQVKLSTFKRDLFKRAQLIFESLFICLILNFGLVIDSLRGLDRNALGFTETASSLDSFLLPNFKITVAMFVALAVFAVSMTVVRSERTADIRLLGLSSSVLILISAILIQNAQPTFESSVLFVVIQLCAAISVGVLVHSFSDEMKLRSFGLFHLAAVVSISAVLISSLVNIPVIANGTFGTPERSWGNQVDASKNERVLYIGDSRVLPGRSVLAPLNRNFSITKTQNASLSSGFSGPASNLDQEVRDVYSQIISSNTTHAGVLLARLSIGKVVVPNRIAPGSEALEKDFTLLSALDRQTDLIRLSDRDGLVVYVNSEFKGGYDSTKFVENVSPDQVFLDRTNNQNDLELQTSSRFSFQTIAALMATIVAFGLIVLWPKRSQLVSNRSLKLDRQMRNDEKSSHLKEEIDLEAEHSLDKANQELSSDSEKDTADSLEEVSK